MQFWGDIVLKWVSYPSFLSPAAHRMLCCCCISLSLLSPLLRKPAMIPKLPSNAIGLIWGYEGTHPFDKQCQAFAESKIAFYVCPGTYSQFLASAPDINDHFVTQEPPLGIVLLGEPRTQSQTCAMLLVIITHALSISSSPKQREGWGGGMDFRSRMIPNFTLSRKCNSEWCSLRC